MTGNGTTDAAVTDAASGRGAVHDADRRRSAMVCEGDVCYVPGFAERGEGDAA